jgi:hypothetical protein
MGEFVELDAIAPARPEAPPDHVPRAEVGDSNWVQSSFDLAIGLEVRDFEDTVPEALLEALFKDVPREK